ncbi:MAG TPA: response regulator transcription factor [Acidimicrobiia bacterium]|jgi:DNA-binding NarL/FixJ family response regulator|nr:response regulator transcription factor [Acidimicrobiia bacterium]
MTIRVVVVDDQPIVRAGFQTILDAQPDIDVVGEAADGLESVATVERLRPDVVVMDIRMPELDGIAATRRITALDASPPTRVLVLTTFDVDDYVYEALRAGASGYLLKDATRDELVNAVRTVADGDALLAPSVTRRLVEEFVRRPEPASRDVAELDVLTPRERDVLEQLARGRSNAEIAQHLFVGEATVKSHVAHVLTKLQLRDRIQAVILAYELGIVRAQLP